MKNKIFSVSLASKLQLKSLATQDPIFATPVTKRGKKRSLVMATTFVVAGNGAVQ